MAKRKHPVKGGIKQGETIYIVGLSPEKDPKNLTPVIDQFFIIGKNYDRPPSHIKTNKIHIDDVDKLFDVVNPHMMFYSKRRAINKYNELLDSQ